MGVQTEGKSFNRVKAYTGYYLIPPGGTRPALVAIENDGLASLQLFRFE